VEGLKGHNQEGGEHCEEGIYLGQKKEEMRS
jgi:hypothetical protein